MKEHLKSILKKLNLYHPLQSAYRSSLSFIRNQYLKLVYARFKGSGFQCNFCGVSYKKFVPEHPAPDIENAIYGNNVIAGFGPNVYYPTCPTKTTNLLLKPVLQTYLPI